MEEVEFTGQGEFDAAVWAQEFCRRVNDGTFDQIDFGLMVGWFSNAIMAGYDYGRARTLRFLKGVEEF